jgi:hypothetical protein
LKIEDLKYARTSKGLFCMDCHEKLVAKKKKFDARKKQSTTQRDSTVSRNSLINDYLSTSQTNLSLVPENLNGSTGNGDSATLFSQPNESETSLLVKNKSLPRPPPGKDSLIKNKSGDIPILQSHQSKDLQSLIPGLTKESTPSSQYSTTNDNPDSSKRYRNSTDFSIEEVNDSDNEDGGLNRSPSLRPKSIPSLTSNQSQLDRGANPMRSPSRIQKPSPSQFKPDTADYNKGLPDTFETPTLRNAPNFKGGNSLEPPVDLNSRPKASPSITSSPSKKFNGTNLLILSPNQFHDNEFHNAQMQTASPESPSGIENNSLEVPLEDPRSRSGALSPFAKANRQARVVESNDFVSTENLNFDNNPTNQHVSPTTKTEPNFAGSIFTTPKKNSNKNGDFTPQLSSPPPKLPLPSTPSSKSSNERVIFKPDDQPKGLGLEGIDCYNGNESRIVHTTPNRRNLAYHSPAVTNLENVNEPDEENDTMSRKSTSSRTPKSSSTLKHKRSISGGSSGLASKLGFFKSNKDDLRGHSRHVSEGSLGGSPSFTSPQTTPLISYPQLQSSSLFNRDHTRSTSDTGVQLLDQPSGGDNGKNDELIHLVSQKQVLLGEVRHLNNERATLNEQLKAIQQKLVAESKNHETLTMDIIELEKQKKKLLEYNRSLTEQNNALERTLKHQPSNSSSTSTIQHQNGEHIKKIPSESSTNSTAVYQSSNNSSSVMESQSEETSEPQRAARLKFWKRKGNQANLVNINEDKSNAGNFNNGGNHTANQYLSANSNGNQNSTSLAGENGISDKEKRKFTKSRSTNILDSILNGTNGSSPNGTAVSTQSPKTDSPNDVVPLYASTIQERSEFENARVPLIVTRCIKEVERRGLDMEGIYRVSGGNSAIVAIENSFANLGPNDKSTSKLDEILDGDINAVTSALKRYLRKLPDPLISYDLYDDFIKIYSTNASSKTDKKLNELRSKVLNRLPPANKHTLYLLCNHLQRVDAYQSVNRMGYKNLSVVFAPTIARDRTGEREMTDMGYRNNATELLLTNSQALFQDYH